MILLLGGGGKVPEPVEDTPDRGKRGKYVHDWQLAGISPVTNFEMPVVADCLNIRLGSQLWQSVRHPHSNISLVINVDVLCLNTK